LLVDSHCHLNYLESPEEALRLARGAGVGAFLCISVEQGSIDQVLVLAQGHADVWASVGQHPEAADHDPAWVDTLLDSQHPALARVVALGEMGLDFFPGDDKDGDKGGDKVATRSRQRERFDYQLGLAHRRDYPAIIHTRAAESDTQEVLAKHAGCQGVLHCFTESWDLAKAALDLGYYISISGIVTFNNAANVREVASKVPRDRLLVETDCPWLAPVPHRGAQNQPAFVGDTARFLADWLDWDFAELSGQTTENFFRLFSRAQR
jgi:TatD DNase family protein